MAGKPSLKKCVEEHCKSCTYDQFAPGSWRAQVENCSVFTCKLWPVRPITMESINNRRKGASTEQARIDAIIDALPDDDEDSDEGAESSSNQEPVAA